MINRLEIEAQLSKILKWNPKFERGYDWGKFYDDNDTYPILCHGTRSNEVSSILRRGLVPESKNGRVSNLYNNFLEIINEFSGKYGNDRLNISNGFFHKISCKYLEESNKTFLTFSPGLAWHYAHIGGENSNRFIENIVKPELSRISSLSFLSNEDKQKIGKLESSVYEIEYSRCLGLPALIMIQADLRDFITGKKCSIFTDRESFGNYIKSRKLFSRLNIDDNGRAYCLGFRYIKRDLSFRIPIINDEVSTIKPIPVSQIVSIVIA